MLANENKVWENHITLHVIHAFIFVRTGRCFVSKERQCTQMHPYITYTNTYVHGTAVYADASIHYIHKYIRTRNGSVRRCIHTLHTQIHMYTASTIHTYISSPVYMLTRFLLRNYIHNV
jgi:hypothetical protein